MMYSMSDEKHRMPTTVGSELAVMSDSGELCGFVGETNEAEGKPFYARPCHDSNLAQGTQWFDTREEAMAFLKSTLD